MIAQSASRSKSSGPLAEEVVPGRIYRLGGHIALDGRISWAAKMPGRFIHHNNYIVLEEDRAYLIDTGLAAHKDIVIGQIKNLLPPDLPITAFVTRPEFMCAGNLVSICNARGIEELILSNRNPFAASADVASGLQDSVRRTDIPRGAIAPLGSSKTLIIIPPVMRLLTTYWVYDAESRTMFTSDLFGHVSVGNTQQPAILDDLRNDKTNYEQVRDHTLMRYHWLPLATTSPLIVWLEEIFGKYEIENIAPTSGCVLKGKPVVRKHYDLMIELLLRAPLAKTKH